MSFFQGASEIIVYLLLLSPLMPESCHVLQALFMKISATHKGSYFQNNYY